MFLPDDDDDDASWELLTHPQETLLSAYEIVSEGNEVVAQMRLKFLTSAGSSTDYPVLQAWLLEAASVSPELLIKKPGADSLLYSQMKRTLKLYTVSQKLFHMFCL